MKKIDLKAALAKITARKWAVIGIIGTLIIGGGIAVAILLSHGSNQGASTTITGALTTSGFIEAKEIELAPEMGGRVSELPFAEGDLVETGDIVVRLDATLVEAQKEIALANLALAEAERDLILEGARDEIIAQAELQVRMAEAALAAAGAVLSDAVTLRDNPQELLLQLIDAETQVAVAQQGLTAAQIQFDMARIGYETADRTAQQLHDLIEAGLPVSVPLEIATAGYQYDQAEANLQGAQGALNGAQGILASLQELVNDPAAIEIQVAQASGSLETARASLAAAQADLDLARSGATSSQVAMADARVAEAQAAVNAIDVMLERFAIKAPIDGMILNIALHPSELSAPGTTVVTLANLEQVEITVYLTAVEFSDIRLNQPVTIRVDSYPGRDFKGTVVYIADEAEFTPQSAQTNEERVNLVYAVKILIDNPDMALKPGMPADVIFESPREVE